MCCILGMQKSRFECIPCIPKPVSAHRLYERSEHPICVSASLIGFPRVEPRTHPFWDEGAACMSTRTPMPYWAPHLKTVSRYAEAPGTKGGASDALLANNQ